MVDQGLALFGAERHRYHLRQPIASSRLDELSADLEVAIPEEMAEYWLELGGGGAGPAYGVVAPDDVEPRRASELYPGITELRRLSAVACGYIADDVRRPIEQELGESWDDSTVEALEGAAARLGLSATPEEPRPAPEYFEVPIGELRGLLGVVHRGCGHWISIVTVGPERGTVVEVGEGGGVWDVANSFATFYEQWLDDAIEQSPCLPSS